MSLALKKLINKELGAAGLAGFVDPAAVQRLADAVQEEQRHDLIKEVLDICQTERNSGQVTAAHIDAALTQLKGGAQAADLITVVNAFAVPKISYDPVGRKMIADHKPRHLLADAQAKQKLYLDRLQLIGQRMRRNKLFQQHNQLLSGSSEGPSAQLTDLQSLRGVLNQPRIVMGCMTKAEDGRRFVLEDSSGSVPLDLSNAVTTAGFFTENCVVVAEGELCHDGAFHVRALGFPPAEARSDLPMASQRLNFFGGPSYSNEEMVMMVAEESMHEEDRIVVCANVWLDRPQTLDALNTLFAGFQGTDVVPAMFVLMGNFHSKGGSGAAGKGGGASAGGNAGGGGGGGGANGGGSGMSYAAIKDGFNKLASLLQQFPRIQNNSHFVFIPGPGDPCPGDVLPQPPLPSFFTEQLRLTLPKVTFASNPCRLRFYSRQIIFFRYDILKRMRRRCIIPPQDGESADADTMWGHLTLTLLQQSHLCPLPLLQQPIYWQYDHALHLYPLPNSVVVADTSPQAQHNHQGCSVFNPGSFADGFFAAYMPCKESVEMSEMPRDGQGSYEEEEEESSQGQQQQMGEAGSQGVGYAEGGEAMREQGQGDGYQGAAGGGSEDEDEEGLGGEDAGEREDQDARLEVLAYGVNALAAKGAGDKEMIDGDEEGGGDRGGDVEMSENDGGIQGEGCAIQEPEGRDHLAAGEGEQGAARSGEEQSQDEGDADSVDSEPRGREYDPREGVDDGLTYDVGASQ